MDPQDAKEYFELAFRLGRKVNVRGLLKIDEQVTIKAKPTLARRKFFCLEVQLHNLLLAVHTLTEPSRN